MPTKTQINKNLKLSEKLLDYLSKNPHQINDENVSYIVLTKEDEELNKLNLGMAKSLVKEGKKVIKAIQTDKKSTPWKFSTF